MKPSQADIARTLRQRVKDIDFEIALLRARQQGLEHALGVVLGEQSIVVKKRDE